MANCRAVQYYALNPVSIISSTQKTTEYIPDSSLIPGNFSGVYIDRCELENKNIVKQRHFEYDHLNELYAVKTETGVDDLKECKDQLLNHAFCVFDFKQIGINMISKTKWEQQLQLERVANKLNEDLLNTMGRSVVPWFARGVRSTVDFMHQDHGGYMSVWTPLKISKRLVLKSNRTDQLMISEKGKSVLFYADYGEVGSVWHAGFDDEEYVDVNMNMTHVIGIY